jgi:hypothetical protein
MEKMSSCLNGIIYQLIELDFFYKTQFMPFDFELNIGAKQPKYCTKLKLDLTVLKNILTTQKPISINHLINQIQSKILN